MKNSAEILAKEQDAKNLKKIQEAFDSKRIDEATRDYLNLLYHDGMGGFRNIFYLLGITLGAPKTSIYAYDSATDVSSSQEFYISDVGPLGTYIVHHRFDNDPMRNQFFTFNGGTSIQLFVSSIVSVIIAAQKSVNRAIDKITGKKYDKYIVDIFDAVSRVLIKHKKEKSIEAINKKIETIFRANFISNAASEVLKIIGNLFPKISVDLVRELDKILPPYLRLEDVFRIKLLFDTVPQINAFIDHVRTIMPDKIRSIRNKFYYLGSLKRGYRDAKIIIESDFNRQVIPIEIICNVRMFFNAERQSHEGYKIFRSREKKNVKGETNEIEELHHEGIVEYNKIILNSIISLISRIGWNIIYEKDLHTDSFFSGFPKITNIPYDRKIGDIILEKIEGGVKNEIFRLPNSPRQLTQEEEISVFKYLAQFILFAALPYSYRYEEIVDRGFAGKFFNFVMRELYRYYENKVL